MAKEDARYALSLATKGQLGMTVNARTLECLIRSFASQKLVELREFNQKIYALAKEVAPSIILFTEANDFDSKTYAEIKEKAPLFSESSRVRNELVGLVDCTADADDKFIASLLHTSSSLPYEECFKKAKHLSPEEKREFLKSAFKYMEFYDTPLREFEYVILTYDLIISASCFAQLKRHRMATLTAQKYNPELGVTVPPSIEEIGSKKEFMEMMEETNHVYSLLKEYMDQGAEYVLTNAHRRRVLLKVNARELYHISRLREDASAQWDIRRTAGAMSRLAKEVMPLACLLIGGKDSYPEVYKTIFGKSPKLSPPE